MGGLQEDLAIARTRGGDGNDRAQEEAGEPDEENTVRYRPIDLAEETIHEQGEEFFSYGEEQKAGLKGSSLPSWAGPVSRMMRWSCLQGPRPGTAGTWIEIPWRATPPPS